MKIIYTCFLTLIFASCLSATNPVSLSWEKEGMELEEKANNNHNKFYSLKQNLKNTYGKIKDTLKRKYLKFKDWLDNPNRLLKSYILSSIGFLVMLVFSNLIFLALGEFAGFVIFMLCVALTAFLGALMVSYFVRWLLSLIKEELL